MRNIGCLWRGDLSPRAWTNPANGIGVEISSGMVHLARAQEEEEGGSGRRTLRADWGPLALRRRVHVLAPLRRIKRALGRARIYFAMHANKFHWRLQ